MIITLKGADFSTSNIGTLSSWNVRVLGSGVTYNGVSFVDKDAALNATVTVAEGYEFDASDVTVTMGNNPVTEGITVDGNTITISIASVTGNVVIRVSTTNTSTGEPDVPEDGGGNDEELEYILLDTDGKAKNAYYQALKLHSGDTQQYITPDFPPSSGYVNKDGETLSANLFATAATKYCCTIVFTPETLPIGSTISIASGWTYRKNYWPAADSYGNRDTASSETINVDEAFWNGKAFVGFNISKGTNSENATVLTDSEKQQIANHEILTITFA